MKKIQYILYILLVSGTIKGQVIRLKPIIGSSSSIFFGLGVSSWQKSFDVISPLYLGAEISSPKTPFSLSCQKYRALSFDTFKDTKNSISQKFDFFRIDLNYPLKKKPNVSFGLGHLWLTHENIVHHLLLRQASHYKSLLFSTYYTLNWLKFGYTKEISYNLGLNVLDANLNHFTFSYNFDKKEKIKENKKYDINILGIIRTFPINYKAPNDNAENYPLFGFSAGYGVEIVHLPSKVSFSLDRDWWLSLNGGSYERDIKAYIRNTNLQIRYRFSTPKEKTFRVGLGYCLITDNETLLETWQALHDGVIKNKFRFFHNVNGISLSASLPIAKKTDLEIRNIFPLSGDKVFNVRRLSIGVVHRFNPLKK